mgnify:CR=1 FL=1
MNQTQDWIVRWCALQETYKAEFYIDEYNKIVWIKSDKVNNWKLFWEETMSYTPQLWVSNSVKYLIEKGQEGVSLLLIEINIAYASRLNKILSNKNINNSKDEQEAA